MEKIDHFKMNRAKARLDNMLKEYGQRGKLKAESLRLKMDLKNVNEEIKGLTEKRDKIQLEVERKATATAAPDSSKKSADLLSEETRALRESAIGSKRKSGISSDGEEVRDVHDILIELNEAIDEQETRADYHRERLAEVGPEPRSLMRTLCRSLKSYVVQVEKRLKALPDFGSAGVWADDDSFEVPEAFAPLKDVNGLEAKFLLRFLFKRAAMFRESDVKAATQVKEG